MKKIFFVLLLISCVIFAGDVFANEQSAGATSSGQVPVAVPVGSTITVDPQETQPIKVGGQPVVAPAATSTSATSAAPNLQGSAASGGPVPMIVTQITISETPQEIKISFDKEAKETQISVAGATVSTTQPVQVEQSKLYMETSVGPQEVKISPTEASGKVPQAIKVQDITLEESSETPVYKVSGAREAKILFFIPVSVPVETQVNAQTGEVVSVQKPWWNFLAW